LAIKKNEIVLLAGKGIKVEIIMLREASHPQKDKGHMFSLICGSWTCKINIHISTYMIINTHTRVCVYVCVCEREREHDCNIGSSDGTRGRQKKQKE
jgi:hypothetical protein